MEERSFAHNLEKRARGALRPNGRDGKRFSAVSLIEDEMALALDQIDRLRERGDETLKSLLEDECSIGTELLQMEERTPRYSPYRFPEREKLQRRLGRIGEERRRFQISHAEKLDALHDRLLSLLRKHRVLKPAMHSEARN